MYQTSASVAHDVPELAGRLAAGGSALFIEVDDLDLDVELDDSVLVVEWGAGLVEQLTSTRLEVQLEQSDGTDERLVRLLPVGGDWADRIRALDGAS